MNLSLLLIYLSACATIGAFRPKRDRFLKFHGRQVSENTDITNDQDKNDERRTLRRNKQLMRLIANTKVGFYNLVSRLNYVSVI